MRSERAAKLDCSAALRESSVRSDERRSSVIGSIWILGCRDKVTIHFVGFLGVVWPQLHASRSRLKCRAVPCPWVCESRDELRSAEEARRLNSGDHTSNGIQAGRPFGSAASRRRERQVGVVASECVNCLLFACPLWRAWCGIEWHLEVAHCATTAPCGGRLSRHNGVRRFLEGVV
jgi:hypothetical protein